MAKKTVSINIDTNAGKVANDFDRLEDSTKSLKQQVKEAQKEAQILAAKFGVASDEALAAQKRLASLKEDLSDFNQRVEALNPEAKFKALGTAVQGVAGGFAAAEGALAVFGNESEDLQKTLVKLQGALALSQGLNELRGLADGFSNLKTVAVDALGKIKTAFLSNPLFAVGAAVIGAVVAATAAWSAAIDENTEKINRQIEISNQKFTAIEKGYDREIALARAAGKDVTELEEKKLKATINRIKAELNLINQRFDFEINKNLEYLDRLGLSEKQLKDVRKAGNKEREKETKELIEQLEQAELALEVKVIESETKKTQTFKQGLDERKAAKEAFDKLAFEAEGFGDVEDAPEVVNQRAIQEQIIKDLEAFTVEYNAMKEYAREEDARAEEARRIKDIQDEQARFQAKLNIATDFASSLSSLGNILTKNAEKNEKYQKAIAVTQLAIDSAMAISKAVAASAGVPFPGNLAAIATAVSAVLANIAAAKQALSKAGGSGSAPTFDTPRGGSISSIPSNFANQPVNNSTDVNAQQVDQGNGNVQQSQPSRVYILQGDIENSNQQANSIASKATIQ